MAEGLLVEPHQDRIVAHPADGMFAARKGEELGLPVQLVDWLQQGTIYVFRPSQLEEVTPTTYASRVPK